MKGRSGRDTFHSDRVNIFCFITNIAKYRDKSKHWIFLHFITGPCHSAWVLKGGFIKVSVVFSKI